MTERVFFGTYDCRSCGKEYIVNEPGKWLCSPGLCHDCFKENHDAVEFARYCLAQPEATPDMKKLCEFVVKMVDTPL